MGIKINVKFFIDLIGFNKVMVSGEIDVNVF